MDTAPAPFPPSDTAHDNNPWALLRALTMFRLLSCLFFLSAPFLPITEQFTATADIAKLLAVSALYTVASLSMAALYWRRQPGLGTQVGIQIYADIIFVTLLMHLLGGVHSGVGILLCASLSATALLRKTHAAIFFAAVATLAVLGQSLYMHLAHQQVPAYPQAAALCIGLFIVSLLSAHTNRQRSASSAVIINQQKQLAGLQSLSNEILRQFDHGLLAITPDGTVAHSNPAALRLLALNDGNQTLHLAQVAPELERFLRSKKSAATVNHQGRDLYVSVKRIRSNIRLLTLMAQSQRDAEAHQLKLATLGQWTAGVAHEIRNPLSAITQAAQLLRESTESDGLPRRLADIIGRNGERIDLIVTDILNLARPSRELEAVPLKSWLQLTAAELRVLHNLPEQQLVVLGDSTLVESIDKVKLRHVIENLCKNSLAHGRGAEASIQIQIEQRDGASVIRVSDDGPGIPADMQGKLFDPFFSNASGGTGLGLFIAREICEQHQIRLRHCPESPGAVFELLFHPRAEALQQAA